MTHPIGGRSNAGKDFGFSVEREGSALLLTLKGELDLDAAKSVHDALAEAFLDPDCVDLLVDMSQLTFLDSSGLGVFATAMQVLRERSGAVYVAGCPPPISRAFAITRLDRLFYIVDNLPDARAARQRNAEGRPA